MSIKTTVHVFTGQFSSRKEACLYSEETWEPEPDESVSDKEYEDWENRNPTWPLREELGCYLTANFIETIAGHERFSYLEAMLVDKQDIEEINLKSSEHSNILILIFKDALGGFKSSMKSTPSLTYCGEFKVNL